MSISEPEVEVSEPAPTGAAVGDVDRSPAAPGRTATPSLGATDEKAAPYRTITDKELTLVQICCDFVCACVALPVSLVFLARLSTVPSTRPASWPRTCRSIPCSPWRWSSLSPWVASTASRIANCSPARSSRSARSPSVSVAAVSSRSPSARSSMCSSARPSRTPHSSSWPSSSRSPPSRSDASSCATSSAR